MANVRKYTGTLTVDASGDGTLTLPSSASDGNISGVLLSIRHIDAGASNYDDGFDFTVTTVESGKALYAETITTTTDFERQPNVPTHADTDGTVGTAEDQHVIANEQIVITVASGGNAKTGSWEVYIG